jgi:hypothetical protein
MNFTQVGPLQPKEMLLTREKYVRTVATFVTAALARVDSKRAALHADVLNTAVNCNMGDWSTVEALMTALEGESSDAAWKSAIRVIAHWSKVAHEITAAVSQVEAAQVLLVLSSQNLGDATGAIKGAMKVSVPQPWGYKADREAMHQRLVAGAREYTVDREAMHRRLVAGRMQSPPVRRANS